MSRRRKLGLALSLPVLLGGLAVVVCAAVGCATNPWLVDLFGPPQVEPEEAYAEQPEGARFDHATFDRLLSEIVTEDGLVDYARLRADPSRLDAYLAQLAAADFEALSRDEKLALLINAYNAFTLRLVLDHWPVASIRDIPESERWAAARWSVGGRTLSLNAIEHEYLRARFVEPRIHFAINCASVGCPPLRAEAYTGARIDAQLDAAARAMHEDGSRWLGHRPAEDELRLTRIYLWYDGDFERAAGSVLDYVARWHPPLAAALERGDRPEIEWLEYDWSLNTKDALE